MNSIRVIAPYKFDGQWVFDDTSVGLVKEAFVAGADLLMEALTAAKGIENPGQGFILLFSDQPFPGYDVELKWTQQEFNPTYGGNWYYCEQFKQEAWLCPALYLYFKDAPKSIFVQAKAKT